MVISTVIRSMPDEWTETLRCPQCHKTGTARLSQDDDSDVAIVRSVQDDFEVIVARSGGPDFQCTTCKVAVIP